MSGRVIAEDAAASVANALSCNATLALARVEDRSAGE